MLIPVEKVPKEATMIALFSDSAICLTVSPLCPLHREQRKLVYYLYLSSQKNLPMGSNSTIKNQCVTFQVMNKVLNKFISTFMRN